jgi:hypothetical protein
MSEKSMIELLYDSIGDRRFGSAIQVAIGLLSSAKLERQSGPNLLLQSSRAVADLHAFRQRSGYYKEGAAVGLDETIEALAAHDVPVRLGVMETSKGYVAMWLDEQDALLGVMVFTSNSKPAEAR